MTTINAAVNPELNKEDGAYYVDCKVSTPSSLARYARSSVSESKLYTRTKFAAREQFMNLPCPRKL